jgi:hypothetical protein
VATLLDQAIGTTLGQLDALCTRGTVVAVVGQLDALCTRSTVVAIFGQLQALSARSTLVAAFYQLDALCTRRTVGAVFGERCDGLLLYLAVLGLAHQREGRATRGGEYTGGHQAEGQSGEGQLSFHVGVSVGELISGFGGNS